MGISSSIFGQSAIENKIKTLFQKVSESESNKRLSAYIELTEYLAKTRPVMVDSVFIKAFNEAEKSNNRSAQANLLILRGYAYTKLHEFKKAAPFYEKAYQIAEEIKDSSALCNALIKIGAANIYKGGIHLAVQDFIRVENISKRIGDKKAFIDATNYLAISYYLLDDLVNAQIYSDKALQLSEQINYLEGKALAYEHISIIKIKQEKYDEALDYCNKVLMIREQADDLPAIASIYYNYSIISNRTNNFDQAIEYTKKSIELRKSFGNINGVGSNYLTLGNIYLRSNKIDSALVYLTKAYQIKNNSGDTRTIVSIDKSLSEVYERKKDYLNAFKYLKEYKALNDSVLGEEARRSASKELARQEMAGKDEEIKHLQAINSYQENIQWFLIILITLSLFVSFSIIYLYVKINKANKKLKTANEELLLLNQDKEKFFRIISHDLRSPFHPIISYSDFIRNEADNLSKEEIKEYAGNICSSAEKIYELLDNLLQWLRLSTGKIEHKPEPFNLYAELSSTLRLFENNIKSKSLELINNIEPNLIAFADKSTVGIIFRNIISNAIKFSNLNGKIILESQSNENELKISITDTGKGISSERLSQLFTNDLKSTRGTNNELGSGLGLLLCKEMTEKNGGKLNVTSNSDIGTTVTFTLPLKPGNKSKQS